MTASNPLAIPSPCAGAMRRPHALRRGAGVVERDGLENRCGRKPTEGSNPSLSASNLVIYQYLNSILETIWNQSFFTEKLGS